MCITLHCHNFYLKCFISSPLLRTTVQSWFPQLITCISARCFICLHPSAGRNSLEKCKIIAKLTKKVRELEMRIQLRLMRFRGFEVVSDGKENKICQFLHTKIPYIHFFEKSQMGSSRHLACLFLIPHLTALANILSLRKKQQCFLQGSLVSLWSWLISQRHFCFSWTTAHLSALIGWNCDFKKSTLPCYLHPKIFNIYLITHFRAKQICLLAKYKTQHPLQWSMIWGNWFKSYNRLSYLSNKVQ